MHTKLINSLIADYNKFQQDVFSYIKENNSDLSEEKLEALIGLMTKYNKEIFTSFAKHLLIILESELAEVENRVSWIRGSIEQTKLFINMIPGDKELYLNIPDFASTKFSDYV